MPSIQFYPVDISYKVVDGKTYVYLFGKTPDNKVVCLVEQFNPYIIVVPKEGFLQELKEQIESIDGVVSCSIENKRHLLDNIDILKVFVNEPNGRAGLVQKLKNSELMQNIIKIAEHDVSFTKNYMFEKGITPFMLYEAEGELARENVKADIVLRPDRIEMISEKLKEQRVLAFDIETYNPLGLNFVPEEFPILMVSVYGKGFKKTIVWKDFSTENKDTDFVDGEAALIERFKKVVEEYKPDIITGYFTDGFDFAYLKIRAEKYNIPLDFGFDYSEPRIFEGKAQSVKIIGINHIDVYKFIKTFMADKLKAGSLDLDSVAAELIGERKNKVKIEDLAEIWDRKDKKAIEQFCMYNLNDARLAFLLYENISKYIAELVKIISLPPYDVTRVGYSQLAEWYLIKQSKAFNKIISSKPDEKAIAERISGSYEGGFVMEPKPGIYENICVFDFKSMYPTIISSHNISLSTLNSHCDDSQKASPPGMDCWFCQGKKGFIPKVLEDLIKRRMRIKEIIKKEGDDVLELRAEILKSLANAFYGYFAYPMSRWYSLECAAATAAWGRHYINLVAEKAESSGFEILYADTDSIFVSIKSCRKKDVYDFVDRINVELPELMELEIEDFYKKAMFVRTKAKTGAKKRYALLCGNGMIKAHGFESIKRNWSIIARVVQEEVLTAVLKENNINKAVSYVAGIISSLKDHSVPVSMLIITTMLQKEVQDYEHKSAHVMVAQKMKNLGLHVGPGSIIEYTVVMGGESIAKRAKLPVEVSKSDYDAEYYISHQVLPAVEGIFDVAGIDIKQEIESKEQKSLKSFI